ncbi:MAG: hypothetical protein ACOVMQ_12595 [Cyclobacteriaceae bacterium]|jgi:hypothetical protein
MKHITIEINDSKAMRLIENLVDLNLIKLLKPEKKKVAQRDSDLIEGSITTLQAKKMQSEVKKMRKEWRRDI